MRTLMPDDRNLHVPAPAQPDADKVLQPDNEPDSDNGLCPNPNEKRDLPHAVALRSRREAFGGRRFHGRRFAQAAHKLNN
ncbi:hypothetical protein FNYG_05493 [Fusarium nygamai]|uniref:Uncharacterized protein n=1 Tax=Gibberella nygamai TaxID=42673 RepID=A0A2K0WFH8_GIBNY|nr:hypothetical protein FNYG_05493 [Fusarium nygamai]